MKKNEHAPPTWDEMLRIEDQYPFFAGNVRSLRMGGFRVGSQPRHPGVRRSTRKHKPLTARQT